ncbi:hypothetical protein [Luteococcus peritonei]|uniref:PH domain-containing protein n=1 Tax=Luteococcus peritonei TaxID=88874 RepID=A0ABW4S0A2_9ACTN
MSQTDAVQPASHRYVLKPAPPVRAFVIAAALVLLGALLVALTSGGLGRALAVLVLLAGVTLAAIAGSSMVRMRTFVDVDAEGYRITGPGTERQGTWEEVTKVTTSANGSHLTLYHGQVGRTHVIAPQGEDEQMTSLVADIAKRLDASRGYGETMNVPMMHAPGLQPGDPVPGTSAPAQVDGDAAVGSERPEQA